MKRLLGGELYGAVVFVARGFDHLRDIGQALAALGTAAATAEDLGDVARAMACGRKFTVFQRVTDAHIHGVAGVPKSRRKGRPAQSMWAS